MSSGSKVNFLIGTKAKLPATGTDGTFYLCSDTGELYHAVDSNGTLALINSVTPYATCGTAVGTKAKTVSIKGFRLGTGSRICVKFTKGNSASSPTLNVNGTGAKAMYYNGTAISNYAITAGRTYEFVYDGTYWVLVGDLKASIEVTPSASPCTITHGLGCYPQVLFMDTDGNAYMGGVKYSDKNTVICTYDSPFTGKIIIQS